MKHYLSKVLKLKPADCKNKTITIPIFSQNRDLSLNKEISEKIISLKNSPNNSEKINYLQQIGFIPSEDIEGGYKVNYKIYDLCKQSLLYYLFTTITTKIKGKNINLNKINLNEEFLKNISNIYKDIKVVFSCFDYQDEEKKELGELIEKMKKYCENEIKVNVEVCDEKQIVYNVFNYMFVMKSK